MSKSVEKLRLVHSFKELIRYLEEELSWPLNRYGFDELTFEYNSKELNLKDDQIAKIISIHQLRPIHNNQPWNIFFIEFESKKIPIAVLRRILNHLVSKKRAGGGAKTKSAMSTEDLLFIASVGPDGKSEKEISFAHFHQHEKDLPTLRVLGWDGGDTVLKLEHLTSEMKSYLQWPENVKDTVAWKEKWSSAFRHKPGHTINTAALLAEELASLAKRIRNASEVLIQAEDETGPLRALHKTFKNALLHDLKEEDFADTFAQTITYGLLAAAIAYSEESPNDKSKFVADHVAALVPTTNPLLKELLENFLAIGGRKGGMNFDELGIQDVVDLLRSKDTDLPSIIRDFGNKTQGEDPVIHFYEHFLRAYDEKLKVERGVFYTPQPVVSYIVRSIHELLQTDFGLEDGLASSITWGEMAIKNKDIKIPKDTHPNSHFVVILDPATGTGTFPVYVIDLIYKTMVEKWKKVGKNDKEIVILWNNYVPKYLLPRLYGYELMMAPYAIAHMKIGLKLKSTGYDFTSTERVRIYLTNTLEPPEEMQKSLFLEWGSSLAHEASAVNIVKLTQHFTILIGNPPYSGISMNKQYTDNNVYKVEPGGLLKLQERKNWLDDDYVKFIRFAESLIEKSGSGILGMITNRGYIDNPTFRGMRWHLRKTFYKIFILDLHGNLRKNIEKSNETIDENVFDIKTGVSVMLNIKKQKFVKDKKNVKIFKTDLFGTRKSKYKRLDAEDVGKICWTELPINTELWVLEGKGKNEYKKGFSVNKLFKKNSTGIVTMGDNFIIDEDKKTLMKKVDEFFQSNISESELKAKYHLGKNYAKWIIDNKKEIKNNHDYAKIVPLAYRPFDIRYTYFDNKLVWRTRTETMQHLANKDNVGLIFKRGGIEEKAPPVFISKYISESRSWSRSGTQGIESISPLYLFTEQGEKIPNIDKEMWKEINDVVGKTTPENVLDYVYATLHSLVYTRQYKEFLNIDFPRVPYPKNKEEFWKLVSLGIKLREFHLMEAPECDNLITKYTKSGSDIVEKVRYENGNVYINDSQCFENVPEISWDFFTGGYQPAQKYLKDRKGRKLTSDEIKHYQKIVKVLFETDKIMKEIDEVIDKYGGWPGAFQDSNK